MSKKYDNEGTENDVENVEDDIGDLENDVEELEDETPKFKYNFTLICCHNIYCGHCFFCILCYPLAIKEVCISLGKNSKTACCLGILFGTGPCCYCCCCTTFILRGLFRKKHKIKGNIFFDILLSCLFPCCTFTQFLMESRDEIMAMKEVISEEKLKE